MSRRLFLAPLILSLVVTAAACGGGGNENTEAATPATTATATTQAQQCYPGYDDAILLSLDVRIAKDVLDNGGDLPDATDAYVQRVRTIRRQAPTRSVCDRVLIEKLADHANQVQQYCTLCADTFDREREVVAAGSGGTDGETSSGAGDETSSGAGDDVSSGAGAGQSYRDTLATQEEKAAYDEAFYACDPSNSGHPREKFVAAIADLYSGGDTEPQAIASGLAEGYGSVAENAFERTDRAKDVWRRACLDALAK